MSVEERITSNSLIAEFMGAEVKVWRKEERLGDDISADAWYAYFDSEAIVLEELKYHSSWDWLMPVVEEICIIKNWSINGTLEWLSESQDRDGLMDKTEVYLSVLEFVKQYNEEK